MKTVLLIAGLIVSSAVPSYVVGHGQGRTEVEAEWDQQELDQAEEDCTDAGDVWDEKSKMCVECRGDAKDPKGC